MSRAELAPGIISEAIADTLNPPALEMRSSTAAPRTDRLIAGVDQAPLAQPQKALVQAQGEVARALPARSAQIPALITPPNLYQRLAAIAAEIPPLKATGTTGPRRGNKPVLSIEDIEEPLRPLFAKHGVVALISWPFGPPIIVAQATEAGGTFNLYQIEINLDLVNADNPSDHKENRLLDIGSNPSAAVSFALKRFYKALFHLADGEDELPSDNPAPATSRPPPATRPARPAPSEQPDEALITEAKARRLFQLAGKRHLDVIKDILKEHGYERSEHIRARDYPAILDKLSVRIAELSSDAAARKVLGRAPEGSQ